MERSASDRIAKLERLVDEQVALLQTLRCQLELLRREVDEERGAVQVLRLAK